MKAAKNSNVGKRRWIDGDGNECGSTAEYKHKGEKNESDEIFFAKESFVGTRLIAS
jgi:hypothetical protein